MQCLVKTPLLIIDDFGLKPLRPPEDEIFHDLVAERYERAATLITSNLTSTSGGMPSRPTKCSVPPSWTASATGPIGSSWTVKVTATPDRRSKGQKTLLRKEGKTRILEVRSNP